MVPLTTKIIMLPVVNIVLCFTFAITYWNISYNEICCFVEWKKKKRTERDVKAASFAAVSRVATSEPAKPGARDSPRLYGGKMTFLPAIEYETNDKPDGVIIWLHGLGADGNDFAPIVPELRLPEELGVRFIFPHAPKIPVTINNGLLMPAWYDILEMEIERKVDVAQLLVSSRAITEIIDREIDRGIDSRRIVLAGFSQGGAVCYQTALACPVPLGGLLAMSTYFATADHIEYEKVNQTMPIEIHHGIHDPVVPERLGRAAVETLKDNGYQPHYRTYPMEHGVCSEQIGHISSWFREIL